MVSHGQKRKFQDAPRQAPIGNDDEQPRRKRKRNREVPHSSKEARPHKFAINPIKSRIRDLERQLRNPDIVKRADVALAHERELAALKRDLEVTAAEKTRKEMIERYHMVRFFERQKATRALKRANKKLDAEEATAAREPLEENVRLAQVDFNYTMYSPLAWKYVSLWPNNKDVKKEDGPPKDIFGPKGDVKMWERVEQATKEGPQALDALRNETTTNNTRDQGPETSALKPAKVRVKRSIHREEAEGGVKAEPVDRKRQRPKDEDEESDFFERPAEKEEDERA
jgi:rRNA-processing protein Efg1